MAPSLFVWLSAFLTLRMDKILIWPQALICTFAHLTSAEAQSECETESSSLVCVCVYVCAMFSSSLRVLFVWDVPNIQWLLDTCEG